jgi:hypothetical protein
MTLTALERIKELANAVVNSCQGWQCYGSLIQSNVAGFLPMKKRRNKSPYR